MNPVLFLALVLILILVLAGCAGPRERIPADGPDTVRRWDPVEGWNFGPPGK